MIIERLFYVTLKIAGADDDCRTVYRTYTLSFDTAKARSDWHRDIDNADLSFLNLDEVETLVSSKDFERDYYEA